MMISLGSWSSFIVLLFVLIEKIFSTKEVELLGNHVNAPIALIEKSKSKQLSLAIPHRCDKKGNLYCYSYNDSENQNGLEKEKLKIACPAFSNKENQIEDEWIQAADTLSEHSTLFFMKYVKEPMYTCQMPTYIKASIDKIVNTGDEGDCGTSGAQMYGIGFSISDKDGQNIQFLPVYKVCYSDAATVQGRKLWYTIHHIVSPSLLFQKEAKDFYEPNLVGYYSSFIDDQLDTAKSYNGDKNYGYNFVGFDDMPTELWELTALFRFNYAVILKNRDSFMGMIRADHYIRLYSRMTNQPLTLYSGLHRETLTENAKAPCFPLLCSSPTFYQVDLFWRIITALDKSHSSSAAVMLVTQHSLKKCRQMYLCDRNIVMVKEYEMGGCTYTCSLSWSTIQLLGLPNIPFEDDLNLAITRQTEIGESEIVSEADTSAVEVTNMIKFMSFASLLDAVSDADADLGRDVVQGFRTHE